MLNYAGDDLPAIYVRALNVVTVAAGLEDGALGSLLELQPSTAAEGLIQESRKEIQKSGRNLEARLKKYYQLLCSQRNHKAVILRPSLAEKRAAGVIPKPTAKVRGYYSSSWMASVSREEQRALTTISTRKIRELRALINGSRNILEITRILDAEYEAPTRLQDVMNYLTLLQKAGLVEM